MRTGISPGNFACFGEKRYEILRVAGFDCVDYGMVNTEDGFYLLSGASLDAAIQEEKTLAAAANVEIWQVHGPWRWPARDFTEEDREERLEKMIRSIRITAKLGCKNWVVHPIMPFGIEEIDSDFAEKTWEINVDFMRKLLEVARSEDVVICLENMPMPRFSLGSPEAILRFVREMNDEHFKICLDTGHVAVFPALSVGDEIRRLGSEIRVLHIHDNGGQRDEHLLPGRGVIDWEDTVLALRQIGFDGVFSLEPGYPSGATLDEREQYYNELAMLAKTLTEMQ